jgi:hypothetical protein
MGKEPEMRWTGILGRCADNKAKANNSEKRAPQGGFRRGSVVRQQPRLKIAEREIRRKDDFSADASDHGVRFDPGIETVSNHMRQKIIVGSADFRAFRNVFQASRLPGF